MKNFAAILLVIFLVNVASAQEKASSFSTALGVAATTTPVTAINGTDTSFTNAFVLAPSVSVFHKGGAGLRYTAYYVAGGSRSGIYMHTLTAAFERYDNKVFSTAFDYTHYFFTNNTSVPYSPINNEVYASLSYKKLWLNPVLSGSMGFGKDENSNSVLDVTVAGGVAHSFGIESNTLFSSIDLEPSLLLNAGTNRYYSFLSTSKYITQNKAYGQYLKSQNGKSKSVSNNGRGNSNAGSSSGSGTTTTTSSSEAVTQSFHISNIELGWYSSFTAGKFKVVPTGSLFFPLTSGNSVSAYWQLAVNYTF